MSEVAANTPRFLVVAPLGRDGELISGFLNGAGYPSACVRHVREVEGLDCAMISAVVRV